jgi:mannose-6-phosphate isomerase
MSDLYPLRFETVLKEKVWGGDALVKRFSKEASAEAKIGESWEISSVAGNFSVVSNGFLAGNNIQELLEVYMGDITGDAIYEKFGDEFPLLIKLIEAREDLSIQVHPGNELARERHNAYGKTEMWYILESQKDANIYTGFREGVTKEMYLEAISNGNLPEILNVEKSNPGDVFFTPSGRIHAIGAGNVLVEIQQTSDITYRIFDWNRKSTGSEKRELHTDLALDAIDFKSTGTGKIQPENQDHVKTKLVECEFFNTNLLKLDAPVKREYYLNDSFVIYICTEGGFIINWDGNHEHVKKGETILLPAMIKEVILEPESKAQILEVYINEQNIS